MRMLRQGRLLAGQLVSIVALFAMGCVFVSASGGTATASLTKMKLTAPANNAVVGTISLSCTVPSNVEWINLDADNNFYASGSAYATSYTTTWNSTSVANGSHSIGCAGYGSNGALLGNSIANITVSNSVATRTTTPVGCTTIPGTNTPVGTACFPKSSYPTLNNPENPVNYGADQTGVNDSTAAIMQHWPLAMHTLARRGLI
jgi:Bacterial Ig domain